MIKTFIAFLLVGSFAYVSCSKKVDVQNTQDSSVTTSTSTASNPTPATSTQTTAASPVPADSVSHKVSSMDNVKITLRNLPATVQPYIDKNFPGYKAVSAASDPLCGGAPAIDVSIKKKGSPTYSLIFKPDGTFVQKEQDIALSSAPKEVMDSFKSKFAGYHAAKQIEKLTLADNSTQYLLDVSKGKQKKEVTFSTDGSVVCVGKD